MTTVREYEQLHFIWHQLHFIWHYKIEYINRTKQREMIQNAAYPHPLCGVYTPLTLSKKFAHVILFFESVTINMSL